MAAWYYTDALARQQGPVDDSTLLDLNRDGAVKARSLVWTEGQQDWIPFQEVAAALFSRQHAADDEKVENPDALVDIGVCAHSGRVYLLPELLPYGEALIGPEHKDDFVRRLMEGAATGIADATEQSMTYVGFWWRVLGAVLDYMIKILPYFLCMIPYYVSIFYTGFALENAGEGDSPSELREMIPLFIGYGTSLLLTLAFSIFYDTWMVGRYGATLGKVIIGAKVVNPDGSKPTYKRAFFRWFVKKPVEMMLLMIPVSLAIALLIVSPGAVAESGGQPALVVATIAGSIMGGLALVALGTGIYWMAAFDPEKRTLHDRITSTRVVKK